MIPRALLFAVLLPLSGLAQLQVFQFDGTNDTAVGTLVNVGTAAPGDTIEARFHVRNMGAGPASLATLGLSGDGFTFVSTPSLPYILAPYVGPASEAEFDIDFSPTTTGSFSAFLAVNTLQIVLQGTSQASATVTLSGSQSTLSAGAAVDFGEVAVGHSHAQAFLLSNTTSSSLTVSSISVSGSGFSGPAGLTLPAPIGSGQSVSFQVTFAPKTGTLYQGTLTIDGRAFILKGQGEVATLPSASMVLASSVGASAQQNSIAIPLAAASQTTGTGTLAMAFQSGVAGVTDDPAIRFLSGPFRIATVSISSGATSATIGGLPSMTFQTGTTAGTITFTLTLENAAPQQKTLVIPPTTVILDTVTAVRQLGAIAVAFSGFDNTYSASQLAFTFYDLKGKEMPQGVIDVNAGPEFQQYFSATQDGGMFALLANFLVTGNTAQIGFVTAQIANSSGTTTTQQIAIAN
jgi:hypothetical protein